MRLTEAINTDKSYQFQFISETDDTLTFTLQRDGQVLLVTLSADGAWPDECYLTATAVEQRDSESSAEFWGHGDEEHVYAERVETYTEKPIVQGGLFA